MARLKPTLLLLLATLLFQTTTAKIPTAPQPISRIFHLDTRDPSLYPSSCLRLLDPASPNSPQLYSLASSSNFHDRSTPLTNIFFQTYSMVVQARTVLQPRMWLKNFEVIKSVYSFWGVRPERDSEGKWVEPRALWAKGKIGAVRRRYEALQTLLETPRPDSDRGKPKIWCDGTFLVYVDVDQDAMRDASGREIEKDDGSGYYSVREWEKKWGRTVDDRWFLYYELGSAPSDERAYITIPREAAPEGHETDKYPFPIDPRTNNPNPCAVSTRNAMVLHVQRPPSSASSPSNAGMSAYTKSPHIILCPNSFLDGPLDANDYLMRTPMLDDGSIHLDAMKVACLTLLHELLHVVFPNGCPDVYPCLPALITDPTTREEIFSPNFPRFRSGFDCERSPRPISGAGQAMSLARYEVALDDTTNPPSVFTDVREMWSWQTPEPFAWFPRAMQMTLFAKQDWSDGTCRPQGSQFTGCVAPIPEFRTDGKEKRDGGGGKGVGLQIMEQVEGCGEDAEWEEESSDDDGELELDGPTEWEDVPPGYIPGFS